MESSNSTTDDPSSSSYNAFRGTIQSTLLRSHSTNEAAFSGFLPPSPRLSCPTLSRSLQSSPVSSPLHPHTKLSDSDPQTTYHCASSVLRKDGQILKCIETFKAHPEPINAIIVADDGVIYTASDDATVRVWRRNFCSHDKPHSLTVTLHAKNSPVKALALTPDGGVLYGGCSDVYIHFWLNGWFAGQLQYGGSIQGHTHAVMCLTSVANYVISGSADSTSRLWARERDGQHTCAAVLVGHRGPIRCVEATAEERFGENSEDSHSVCTGSLDGVLKLWRVTQTKKKEEEDQSSPQNEAKYFEL